MAMSNHERVGKAMDLLKAGLAPFVEREMQSVYGSDAIDQTARFVNNDRILAGKPVASWDVSALIKLLWEAWNDVFRRTLGPAERSLVAELRDHRNKWAHQQSFTTDDVYRVLDSTSRLLSAVSAAESSDIEKMKMELLRVRFEEQARLEKRRSAGTLIEGASTLTPWREIVAPHPDVAKGKYLQAEFAADLWQVHLGEGSDEYRRPAEFFRRTYLTESLKQLLVGAARRLGGESGDPVVQLQTNFGGGKTHSMLALYHLLGGEAQASELPGADEVLRGVGVGQLPVAKRVVLVGNKISPGNPSVKSNGTVVRTLWGELAWQLGGPAAYERVRLDDERATSPGDALRELFNTYGPCLILIDEWVAYARQLHEVADLPGGSFETHFSFAQALSESARLARNTLLVVSLPASDTAGSPHTRADDVEVGGQRGREALERLRNVIGRVESSWRPASAEEGFEIVRRRLFEPLGDPQHYVQRDAVARAFIEMYRANAAEYPPECRDSDYEKRLKDAYPIHPEIFDRLYTDWSTLVKFQRTRGVLRLMAAVIHSLWEKGDRNPLIMPSTLPIDDPRVQFELTRYLSDNWVPVIEKDVDGPGALPLRIDADLSATLGRYAACRRVARTIYLGSAPTSAAANRGLEDRRIRLGCVMPGESGAMYGDALRRLSGTATYLYQDGPRYWYSTQPTVTRLAEDIAEQLKSHPDRVFTALQDRLKEDTRRRGEFARVHVLPRAAGEVPDQTDAALVVLGPDQPYAKDAGSAAEAAARALLDSRGSGTRQHRNTLVFLAPDQARLQDLTDAIRKLLAWNDILRDKESLDLSPHQVKQAETQRTAAESVVNARLPETWQWLLVPVQDRSSDLLRFEAIRLTGSEGLAVRASKKLIGAERLVTELAGTSLSEEMNKGPLWRGDHVSIRQLTEDYASLLHLSRLTGSAVLFRAIEQGLSLLSWDRESFAYAEGWDEEKGRYRGLITGRGVKVTEGTTGLLVKPEVAQAQIERERPAPTPVAQAASASSTGLSAYTAGGSASGSGSYARSGGVSHVDSGAGTSTTGQPQETEPQSRRFYGSVALDIARPVKDFSRVIDEVIQHLTRIPGAKVQLTLDVSAQLPDGVPETVERTVMENCVVLKFTSKGFEEE